MPINELRVSGSKLEPPSRPSQDWSKQRPYFGPNPQKNLSVELGKTAHLVCKVFELGDKTVSVRSARKLVSQACEMARQLSSTSASSFMNHGPGD